jgi:hypothetical protein
MKTILFTATLLTLTLAGFATTSAYACGDKPCTKCSEASKTKPCEKMLGEKKKPCAKHLKSKKHSKIKGKTDFTNDKGSLHIISHGAMKSNKYN